MRLTLPLAFLIIASCATSTASDNPRQTVVKGDREITTVIVRAPPRYKKCKIAQPDELTRPLPLDNPKAMIDRLTAKLTEWVNYGEKVEKNC
jgi:hypothetical protein